MKGNFKAKYASDNSTAVHMLSIDDYAESVEDPTEHSWVLLGEKPPAAPVAAPPVLLQLMSPAVEPTPAAAAAPRIAGQGNGRAGPSSAGTASPSSSASMAGPSSAGMGRTGREPLPPPDMSMLDTLDHRHLAEMQVRIAKMLATGATPAR